MWILNKCIKFASVLTQKNIKMKKGLLFIAVISAFSFASCKKDQTCTCTSTYNGVASGTADVTTYPKSTKAAARANCMSSTQVDGTVTTITTCELK